MRQIWVWTCCCTTVNQYAGFVHWQGLSHALLPHSSSLFLYLWLLCLSFVFLISLSHPLNWKQWYMGPRWNESGWAYTVSTHTALCVCVFVCVCVLVCVCLTAVGKADDLPEPLLRSAPLTHTSLWNPYVLNCQWQKSPTPLSARIRDEMQTWNTAFFLCPLVAKKTKFNTNIHKLRINLARQF